MTFAFDTLEKNKFQLQNGNSKEANSFSWTDLDRNKLAGNIENVLKQSNI